MNYCNIFKILLLSIFTISCKENSKKVQPTSPSTTTYIYNEGNHQLRIDLAQPPKRVATFAPHATEILLALGLADKMIIASTEEEVLPQYREAYEKIPQKLIGHSFKMNKEAFLLKEPDFVVAYPYDLKQDAIGTPEDLIKNGIHPFVLESITTANATLENVYNDILTLGKIFSVQGRAEQLVSDMKMKLNSAQIIQPKSPLEKPKVMLVNSFNNGVWIGGGLASDLIDRAGGTNVYNDVSEDGAWVSYESMLARNPDIIIITDIASRPMKFDEKVKLLKSDPVLKDISAVKNNKIYKANHSDVNPGVRNVDFILRMNKIFYQNGK